MATLPVEDGRSIYYEHRPGASLTVVLSHGWGMGGRVWDGTVATLRDAGYGTLAIDHRACGGSDKDFADVSIEALGRDVLTICEALAIDRAVLNGWSLGGAVMVEAAGRLGLRLRGLVLTAAASPRFTRANDFPFGGTAADVAGTVAALRNDRVNVLHGLYHQGVFAVDVGAPVKDWCWRLALDASPCADASLAALATLDQRRALANIAAPALVIVGGRDGVVEPGIGRAAANLLPNATLIEMSACGHAPFLEDRTAYHRALLDWLGALPARRS